MHFLSIEALANTLGESLSYWFIFTHTHTYISNVYIYTNTWHSLFLNVYTVYIYMRSHIHIAVFLCARINMNHMYAGISINIHQSSGSLWQPTWLQICFFFAAPWSSHRRVALPLAPSSLFPHFGWLSNCEFLQDVWYSLCYLQYVYIYIYIVIGLKFCV